MSIWTPAAESLCRTWWTTSSTSTQDRKAHGMIAEKSTSIYQKGGYTRKDVEKNILSNPFKRFEDMRFLMRCKDVETIEVNPIIFRKLTREDWLHIVDVCDKSLEKYYLRLKK